MAAYGIAVRSEIQNIHYALRQANSTRSSRATSCSGHSVMLPPDTIEMRKRVLTIFLANLKENAEAIFTTYLLSIYADIHY